MTSADWYFTQADLLRGRAEACRQLARQLDGAALFDLHLYSGDLTWQCPVATEFDEQLAGHCIRLSAAIDDCAANALGLSGDADDLERQGAYVLASQREDP